MPQIALGDGLPGLSPNGFGVLDDSVALTPAGFPAGAGAIGNAGAAISPALSPPPLRPENLLPSPPVTSPAPEVSTWSMMVVGAGVVGGAIRWRRREQTA